MCHRPIITIFTIESSLPLPRIRCCSCTPTRPSAETADHRLSPDRTDRTGSAPRAVLLIPDLWSPEAGRTPAVAWAWFRRGKKAGERRKAGPESEKTKEISEGSEGNQKNIDQKNTNKENLGKKEGKAKDATNGAPGAASLGSSSFGGSWDGTVHAECGNG